MVFNISTNVQTIPWGSKKFFRGDIMSIDRRTDIPIYPLNFVCEGIMTKSDV